MTFEMGTEFAKLYGSQFFELHTSLEDAIRGLIGPMVNAQAIDVRTSGSISFTIDRSSERNVSQRKKKKKKCC